MTPKACASGTPRISYGALVQGPVSPSFPLPPPSVPSYVSFNLPIPLLPKLLIPRHCFKTTNNTSKQKQQNDSKALAVVTLAPRRRLNFSEFCKSLKIQSLNKKKRSGIKLLEG
jgi:hypothetical protein